jgi:hypothetical protein
VYCVACARSTAAGVAVDEYDAGMMVKELMVFVVFGSKSKNFRKKSRKEWDLWGEEILWPAR